MCNLKDHNLSDLKKNELIEFRRLLHQNPELSFKELETTKRISSFLENEGLNTIKFKDLTGLFVELEGVANDSLPLILVRADIDALPIKDLKECSYKSKNDGVMHACGHDVHTTSVLGMILILNELRHKIPFRVRAVFQPAEELGLGALALVKQDILSGVDYAISLHVDPLVPLGKIAIRSGPINATVREIKITFKGRPTHAARMYQGIDAIGAACSFVNMAYADIPRRIDARDPHLLYFGSFHGGYASNIVADEVTILGTIRAFTSEVSDKILDELMLIGKAVSLSSGADFHLEENINVKPVINNPLVSNAIYEAGKNILGEKNIITDLPASMGGEDFGAIMEHVPGAMMRLGVAPECGKAPPVHTQYFDVPEECIFIAASILAESVLKLSGINT
ncbi:MAG TPA: M20 family metallopeptidase [Oligoflexia bacterium]|nr:M20 family metallopeptidase [Oligoflexia bacterium]HMP47401.1 M20 family metallopeptidase [Oligoflexia bacterium]